MARISTSDPELLAGILEERGDLDEEKEKDKKYKVGEAGRKGDPENDVEEDNKFTGIIYKKLGP